MTEQTQQKLLDFVKRIARAIDEVEGPDLHMEAEGWVMEAIDLVKEDGE